MKKIVLSATLVAAMVLGTANVYAQTPAKKCAKTEQTTTKKEKAEKKECKKECTKKASCSTPTTKAEKNAPKK